MQEYNISYSLDSKYSEQLAVSIASILKNAENSDNINFYILDGGISKEDKENLEKLKSLKAFNIEYIKVDNKDFKSCPLLKDNKKDYHVTLPTYYRFKLPEYLNKLDKVLYLDCDVIIRTSLKELFNYDITQYPAAMVLDAESDKEAKRLNIKKYFNAGVMLINLDYWRKNNIENLLFDYAINKKDKILWQDQDIINCVLDGKIKELDNIWNFQYFQYEKVDNKQLSDINIFHLAGRFKPWLMPFEHTIYDLYYYYLSFSAWKNKIEEYRQTGSGKFLKNGIGGNITNITVNATDEDIQNVYEKISQSYDFINNSIQNINQQTDSKINIIYTEIDKAYNYTKEEIEKSNYLINKDTDEKISKIYDELTANYTYTNDTIKDAKYFITVKTDEKISKVYDEITKNYKYTEKIVQDVNDDLSKTIKENNFNIQNLIQEKTNQIYEDFNNKHTEINNIAQNLKAEMYQLNFESEKNFDNKIQELQNNITEKDKNNSHHQEILNNKIINIYDVIAGESANREELLNNLRDEFKTLNANTNTITDEKISKIFEEITKNYNYTESLVQEAEEKQNLKREETINNLTQDYNKQIQAQKEELENEFTKSIKETSDSIKKETIVKISEVYSYINSQSSNLYNEIKNSNNNVENNINYKLWDIYKTNENQNYEINTIKTKLEDKTEKTELQKMQEAATNKINELNIEHTNAINDMRLDFEDKLNQQRIKYEKKLMNMEKLIHKIEEKQEEAKKNIFVKLIKKLKR